jgi:ectoine hydroxylase-related dioxygenase (phytanoyl-CoA dioxygenase family)
MDLSVNKFLAQDLAAFYREHGYCVLKDVLSKNDCARYLDLAESIAKREKDPHALLMNPDREHPEFRRLMCLPSIVGMVELFQEAKIDGLQSMFDFIPPGNSGYQLHQDNQKVQAADGGSVSIWIVLESMDQENGGLVAYEGSHREPIQNPCLEPEQYPKIYLEAPAGACVFAHGNLIHGSEENISKTRFRRVFLTYYVKQGTTFNQGASDERRVIHVYPNGRKKHKK